MNYFWNFPIYISDQDWSRWLTQWNLLPQTRGDYCKWNHSIRGLLCLVSFMWLDVAFIVVRSFLWLDSIPLPGYTTFYSSIHQLIDIWAVNNFWLLWIMLLWTMLYKFLCGCTFSIPLDILYLELDSMFMFWENCQLLSKGAPQFHIFTSSVCGF